MRSIRGLQAAHFLFCVLLYLTAVAQARRTPLQRLLCSGRPAREDNIRPWPRRCADASAGFTCRAKCATGSNMASAVCQANGAWALLSNNCPPVPVSTGCTQQPAAVQGATWSCSSGSCNSTIPAGTVCTSSPCGAGFAGPGYVATCLPGGKWSKAVAASNSSSTAGCSTAVSPESSCLGSPAQVANASWDMECVSSALAGVECTATCSAPRSAESGVAGYTSTCTELGKWTAPIGPGCSSGNGNIPSASCPASPPAVEGVAWETCDTTAGSGIRCHGLCKMPYRGLGYFTMCNANGQWDVPEKQLPTDIGCKTASCAGSLPMDVQGASWDTACSAAGMAGNVCFARCASDAAKAAYISECSLQGTWTEPQKMADC